MNCSLRDNITFGAPYDQEWYERRYVHDEVNSVIFATTVLAI
eukprot:COSAG05_NODE_1829_length_4002_cov_3.573917_4_plen_42_part_00